MLKLLIIADDLTGAFDSGVQFAAKGTPTTVLTNPNYDFQLIGTSAEVLVIVAETRHLQPQEAYKIVYHIVHRALEAGITYIYKKTDSALRGNIGSELTALMNAAGVDSIPFLPAFPKLNRVTRSGIHYIDGIPVAQSVFGQDLFEPIVSSEVAEILGRQTDVPIVLHPQSEKVEVSSPGIQIFDAETDDDLSHIGKKLGLDQLRFSAGCAGFATVLADLLKLKGEAPKFPDLEAALFVACGSTNPITVRQIDLVQKQGFPRMSLSSVQKLEKSWLDTDLAEACIQQWVTQAATEKRFILDVNDPDDCDDTNIYIQESRLTLEQLRVQISDNLAALVKRMLDTGLKATLLCTGGDTLLALMQALGVSELTPICEMATGVVLAKFVYKETDYHIISKSGGFGNPDLIVKLAEKVLQKPKKY